MKLCEYGCGKEAKHQFKNGRWCCSKSSNSCIEFRKKLSAAHIGQFVSIETRRKQSKSRRKEKHPMYGKIGKLSPIYGIKRTKETKKIQRKKAIERYKDKNERKKAKIRTKLTIEQIKDRYPTFSKVEEMRYEPGKEKEKIIQVHCKNHKCKNSKENNGWFTPTIYQIYYRRNCIEYDKGGSYFYCSEKCKQECSIFGKSPKQLIKEDQIKAGYLEEPGYNSSEYQDWRQHILELDNNKCVYCEKEATVAHHILPQKTHPESALDPENGIAVCKSCHYKYGHRDSWCTTGKLSTLVCERIIRIKNKIKGE